MKRRKMKKNIVLLLSIVSMLVIQCSQPQTETATDLIADAEVSLKVEGMVCEVGCAQMDAMDNENQVAKHTKNHFQNVFSKARTGFLQIVKENQCWSLSCQCCVSCSFSWGDVQW